jgi:peptide/nickel transport system ATP-binding protein
MNGDGLEVSDLTVDFRGRALVRAVDGVSFAIEPGRTLALVGESGSGKTVTATAVLGLLGSGAVVSGSVSFGGRDLLALPEHELRRVRGARIAMVFQDSLAALNPVLSIGAQIVEAIRAHRRVSRRAARASAVELLAMVGIPDPERRVRQYPHEFSGGMRQRAMIAMALALEPEILIADEPTTALDVTVQAQILELLARLQERFGMGLILVTHDLGIVAQVADEIVVMYAGRMVERGTPEEIFYEPQHPYTWGLTGSVPRVDDSGRLRSIPGQPPSLLSVPPGCPFHPRCAYAFDRCVRERPHLERRGGHDDACFLGDDRKRAARSDAMGGAE